MIGSISDGFVEHGHLAGTRAHIVPVSLRSGALRWDFSQLSLTDLPFYFFVESNGSAGAWEAERACTAADTILAAGGVAFIGIRPGVPLPSYAHAERAILRVLDGDAEAVTAHMIETRCRSVSIHAWMGSNLLHVLEDAAEFPNGRSLILDGDDFGEAKVYLSTSPSCAWKLVRAHPYNDIEPAEFTEMTRG